MSAAPVITPAVRAFNADGTPYAPAYDDIYHSASGALGQALHVFLGGNGLPQRWRGTRRFTILETGFGLGLNFLATWQAWRDDPERSPWLHYVSVEKHPFTAADLPQALNPAIAGNDAVMTLARQLVQAWPMLTPGLHRLSFEGGQVTLTLAFGDAEAVLPQLALRADAIYLDGFAPPRNPAMWSAAVFTGVARHAVTGASLATYTSAAEVREGLIRAGFAVERVAGFATKRHMLRATRLKGRAPPAPGLPAGGRHALVIGAGLAGCGVTHALAARGWRITLLERAGAPATQASGNAAGTFHPMFARDETPLTRLTRNAFLHGTAAWREIEARGRRIAWQACGALQLPGQRQGAAGIPQADAWPAELVRNVDRAEARELTGVALKEGGLWFPGGGWMDPASLCHAQLQDAGDAVEMAFETSVARCEYAGGAWHAIDSDGRQLASAPAIVLADAYDAMRLLPGLAGTMRTVRGQVTLLAPNSLPTLTACVLGRAYMIPARDGRIVCGTTYQPGDLGLDVRAADHEDNLRRCSAALEHGLSLHDPASLEGRAGIRAVTRDRLPMMGALGGDAWCASGFASRGILWGTLAGEVIAAQLEGEPAPLEAPLLRAVDPCRFARPTAI
jgi:tRNA 5-methylaminomethyl-2-thiouridine biosynthesis bifunctional protein